MMTIHLNYDGDSSLNYFIRNCVQPDFLEEPILKRALYNIDNVCKTEGLAFYTESSSVLSPESLSEGVKALILCYYNAKGKYDRIVSNLCMYSNVGPYLCELSMKYDFDIAWDCFLNISNDNGFLVMNFTMLKSFYCTTLGGLVYEKFY